ncbi:MAG TPA: hypothetical protein DCR93_21560 [Cytophagales bacterium]|nr:hypothetical protein [Cytophagales bacterium]
MTGCHSEEPIAELSGFGAEEYGGTAPTSGSGTAIYSPGGHFYAASDADVLQAINCKLVAQGQTAVALNSLDFMDDARYSFAVVGVVLADGTPKDLFTMFRYTDQVSVNQSGSTVSINGGAPSQNFVDGGVGLSPESTITIECGKNGGCSDGRCKFSEVSVHLNCHCVGGGGGPGTPQATDDIIITSDGNCKARILQ